MTDKSQTTNSYVVPLVVILMPIALLVGNLSAGQILRHCDGWKVFSCMDQAVTTTLDAYDPTGLAKVIREAATNVR